MTTAKPLSTASTDAVTREHALQSYAAVGDGRSIALSDASRVAGAHGLAETTSSTAQHLSAALHIPTSQIGFYRLAYPLINSSMLCTSPTCQGGFQKNRMVALIARIL